MALGRPILALHAAVALISCGPARSGSIHVPQVTGCYSLTYLEYSAEPLRLRLVPERATQSTPWDRTGLIRAYAGTVNLRHEFDNSDGYYGPTWAVHEDSLFIAQGVMSGWIIRARMTDRGFAGTHTRFVHRVDSTQGIRGDLIACP